MTAKHLRRSAAAIAASAIVGLVAVGAQPATAAQTSAAQTSAAQAKPTALSVARQAKAMRPGAVPGRSRASSVRAALIPARVPSTIAVVRGPNRVVYATNGAGTHFVNLGGQVIDDPAVASSPDQIWILGKGTNKLLYLRTLDTAWQLVADSPVLGTSLTASVNVDLLEFTYIDATSTVHLGTIDPGSAEVAPSVTFDQAGPTGFGAAVNASAQPLFISGNYVPGLLGATGDLKQWDAGLLVFDPGTVSKRFLSCARDRFGTAATSGAGTYPVGAVACRSEDSSGNINFLGLETAHNLGGHIIGSPGIAMVGTDRQISIVYVTGTDHMLYSTAVKDGTTLDPDAFSASPFNRIGGNAAGGVQAVDFEPAAA